LEPVERFLAYLASIEKSPKTLKAYAHDLKDWFTYLAGHDLEWRAVTVEDVAGFGDCDHDLVRAGNEAVLRARYEDAGFFWHNDLKKSLAAMKERLTKLTFETQLGSMADRAERIAAIALELTSKVAFADQATLRRAGELAKFDLGSEMVVELSSLAGVMAREYARRAGESDEVAQALFEMELPRHAGDALPVSPVGAVLALADRLDLLAGLFAIGSEPTGSSDPFGLRRAALGVVNVFRTHPALEGLSIRDGLAIAAGHQPVSIKDELPDRVLAFIGRRFEQVMIEQGHSIEHIRAVGPLIDTPARAERTLNQLTELIVMGQFQELVAAIQRVRRIVPDGTKAITDPTLFENPAEGALKDTLDKIRGTVEQAADLQRFATQAATITGPINDFFDEVLVMAEDPAVRTNRLGLLASTYQLADGLLDWKELT
jgi:glycyl-tRNA synthetase